MRAVDIPEPLIDSMARHAQATYPDECCGFLTAPPDPHERSALRTIVSVHPAANDFEGERRRRFLLRAEELRDAERRYEGTGLMVAGFYHSHPDHTARPSLFDQEHAWPWYTYVVLGVTARGAGEVRAFELDPDSSEFREVPLKVLPDPDRRSTVATR